jgi:hypothetical protein
MTRAFSVQKLVEDTGHGGLHSLLKPINLDGPVGWTPLLDTPKQQPGTHQEVLMCDFVQRPDLRIVCNLGPEIEDREARR